MAIEPQASIINDEKPGRLLVQIIDRLRGNWFITDVLIPFLVTRALLVLVGVLVQTLTLPISPEYPITRVVADRWHFSIYPLVDMWMRWDTGWYFRVASLGYTDAANLGATYSSLAFFPLYPGLVRVLLNLLGAEISATNFGLAGILVSNLSLLVGLAGLHRLASDLSGKPSTGRWAVWWALVFPAAFFFSTVYTESIWFAFAVTCLLTARQKRWALAGVLGICVTLTRAQGFLILFPLGWLYMAARGWNLRRLDRQVLWLSLPCLALIGWFAALYPISGSFMAPITAQSGWGRTFGWPWQSLFFPTVYLGVITRLEQLFLSAGLLLSAWALWRAIIRSPGALSPAFSMYALVLLLLPLFGGMTHSGLRYVLAAFPLYLVAASWRNLAWARIALGIGLFGLQLVLFARWCLFYWVG